MDTFYRNVKTFLRSYAQT